MATALVCPFGQFESLCRTSGTALRWTIDFPDGIGVADPGDRIISATSSSPPPIVIKDSSILLISRTSLSPLTSLLEISNTIAGLNGTRIQCTSIDGTETTVITIIGNGIILTCILHDLQFRCVL